MRIGIPREIKSGEHRVAASPSGVATLTRAGHEVLVEAGAGEGSSMPDQAYVDAGATIVDTAAEVWAEGDLLLKVKEPIGPEFDLLRPDQILFTYLHLAAAPECARALLDAGTTSIAYETVTDDFGELPLLTPMSQVAGRLAVQVGAYHLMGHFGGRGILLPGVPGTRPARVTVIGAGQVGASAVAMAHGLRADVTVLDLNPRALKRIDDIYRGTVDTVFSTAHEIERELLESDLVIGAVLVPGAKAPTLVPDELVARMKPGSVLVDVAIDQGGCFESSRPTTHDDPVFKVHDSLFYCVANMPGAVANTSTQALANATLPYALALAEHGWPGAAKVMPGLSDGLMTHEGALRNRPVAEALDLDYVPAQ
ncbi:alanine dehydrogenase [Corynebacterium freneyi]|uniref:Alanine dehydrogenase n=1 Tax=Corynebacterium freneyi DNF00450 TaxID=1287475 RepID=A0A095XXM9_9CORY|nr:alanine dehydrogenase [Corynebacterium freneyi]KGF14758.1 alanine dehydrogenase [Corynebacterium freneyi DNF00450]